MKSEQTFNNVEDLASFWNDVYNQNEDRFSPDALRRLYILCYAPNSMWGYILSVYYMKNRDGKGMLKDSDLIVFLDKITAFIWTYAVTNPGVNSLRTPLFAEMINIIDGLPVEFPKFKFAKNRNDKEHSLSNPELVESLGNKAVLEKRINIRASDYRFEDKKKYYTGYRNNHGVEKEATMVSELLKMASEKNDFTEADINARKKSILDRFYKYIEDNGLMQ